MNWMPTRITIAVIKKWFFLMLMGVVFCASAQQPKLLAVQRDTSFTVQSDFIKVKKTFPHIRIAESENAIYPTTIEYQKKDNRSLFMDAYLSNTLGLKPVIIMIHGGGWKSGDKSQMKTLAKELAAKGFNCFAVEYRLSPEAKYPAALLDVQDAIQFVIDHAQEYQVDASKMAVLGCSSGGQMASLIGSSSNFKFNNNIKINAIINIDGIVAFKHPESKEKEAAAMWLGGTFEEVPQLWHEAAALNHADKNTPPILFINSVHERFHAGRDDMINILNSYHIFNKTKTIPNTPHTFWFYHPWFNETLNSIVEFLHEVFYTTIKN